MSWTLSILLQICEERRTDLCIFKKWVPFLLVFHRHTYTFMIWRSNAPVNIRKKKTNMDVIHARKDEERMFVRHHNVFMCVCFDQITEKIKIKNQNRKTSMISETCRPWLPLMTWTLRHLVPLGDH